MTDDEIKRLIEKADAAHWATYAELARDALRFRHLAKHAELILDPVPEPGKVPLYGWSLQWGRWNGPRGEDVREAIDHDMRKQP
jgi:hypothetical protein